MSNGAFHIGLLRDKVTFSTPVREQDGRGGAGAEVLTDYAQNVPASIRPLTANEINAAAALEMTVTHSLIIRWLAGVKNGDRVTLPDGREARVMTVEEFCPPNGSYGQRRFMIIKARQGAAL